MSPTVLAYAYLLAAVVCEVTGTTMLAKSEQFTKALPTLAMALCFGIAFFCLTQVLKHVPLGITYAIWAGLGIVLTALVGVFLLKQPLDVAGMVGIALIVLGVIVINIFSGSSGH